MFIQAKKRFSFGFVLSFYALLVTIIAVVCAPHLWVVSLVSVIIMIMGIALMILSLNVKPRK